MAALCTGIVLLLQALRLFLCLCSEYFFSEHAHRYKKIYYAKKVYKIQSKDKVLIVGLGNLYSTPDSLGSKVVKNVELIKEGIAITSSHNLSSEKQFRFPASYGAHKPNYATFTATGA